MASVHLTPADLPDLAARLGREAGPVIVADIDRWSDADLDDLRLRLSTLDPRRSARIDGESTTLDALVDHIVDALGRIRGHRAVRAHRPDLWSEAERVRIQAAMDFSGDDVWFYIDGEPELMDSGLLFDVYEPYIFTEMY